MMKRVLKVPRLLWNGKRLLSALRRQTAGEGVTGENRLHMEAGIKWLMRAQEKGGGGYSGRYCLHGGWDRPYIETTGYIIPTMIAAGKNLKDDEVLDSAKRAADWLCGMQGESGAFCDGDTGNELVFDTGQVLTGLLAAFRQWGDDHFLDAAVRAGMWLAEVQEEDGSWERYSYNNIRHSYYVKVAAALLELARATGEGRYREAALKNIRWTLGCQKRDGYFEYAWFKEGEHPFLHTIVYVIEGLMDSYDVLKEEGILDAAMKTVAALKEINYERDMLLCSQYGEHWEPSNRERCISGLAQWSCAAMRAYERTGDEGLLRQAIKTMYYLKSKQYLQPDRELYGSLPGSVPLWGKYIGFCYPNWGGKFFVDALLAYEKYAVPPWREQEIWVAESFRFSESVVNEELGAHDRKYIAPIETELDTGKNLTVLDIGCGKGKFMRYFRQKFPHWAVTGVDPFFYGDQDVLRGGVCSLPVPDNYADVVLLIEVMQHVDDMKRAMAELWRVTKEGGCLIIGDRDPRSLVGFFKPFMEATGRWMYAWDSPFRERWRSVKEWENILGDNWLMTFARSFDNPDNRIPLSNRFYLLTARKKGS